MAILASSGQKKSAGFGDAPHRCGGARQGCPLLKLARIFAFLLCAREDQASAALWVGVEDLTADPPVQDLQLIAVADPVCQEVDGVGDGLSWDGGVRLPQRRDAGRAQCQRERADRIQQVRLARSIGAVDRGDALGCILPGRACARCHGLQMRHRQRGRLCEGAEIFDGERQQHAPTVCELGLFWKKFSRKWIKRAIMLDSCRRVRCVSYRWDLSCRTPEPRPGSAA